MSTTPDELARALARPPPTNGAAELAVGVASVGFANAARAAAATAFIFSRCFCTRSFAADVTPGVWTSGAAASMRFWCAFIRACPSADSSTPGVCTVTLDRDVTMSPFLGRSGGGTSRAGVRGEGRSSGLTIVHSSSLSPSSMRAWPMVLEVSSSPSMRAWPIASSSSDASSMRACPTASSSVPRVGCTLLSAFVCSTLAAAPNGLGGATTAAFLGLGSSAFLGLSGSAFLGLGGSGPGLAHPPATASTSRGKEISENATAAAETLSLSSRSLRSRRARRRQR